MKLSAVTPFVLSLLFALLILFSDSLQISAQDHVRVAPLVTSEIEFPGKAPGKAVAFLEKNRIVLENNIIFFQCSLSDKTIKPEVLMFKQNKKKIEFKGHELFSLCIGSAPLPAITEIGASQFILKDSPSIVDLQGQTDSVRLDDRFNGKAVTACFVCPKTGMNVKWKAILTDNASFLRQELVFASPKIPIELREIVLLDFNDPTARISSATVGSPVVCDSFFAAVEHPAATNAVKDKQVRCSYPCGVLLRSSQELKYSSVLGVWPKDQLRRSFLYYLERCRACPYHAFLQQNNGSQIGRIYYGHTAEKDKPAFRAGQAKLWFSIMEKFCTELIDKRGVVFDSFVHDYGWDDETLVWRFHKGYPNGFQPFFDLMDRHHSHLGIWYSPWGGYPGKKIRIEEGNRQGLELYTIPTGKAQGDFSMSGLRYYDHVLSSCLGMLYGQKVNYFKFDGFGFCLTPKGKQEDIDRCRSDVEGILQLMKEIRQADPSVFINPSSGTWPSPFWLLEGDSIWRGGYDTGHAGREGSLRQQWITFRDAGVYDLVRNRGPLYPISSLMIHGIEVNKGGRVTTFDGQDIDDEIRAFFATGVNLQELYVSPELLDKRHWNTLAECAKWSRANSRTLADVHWIGGDPANLQIYGRAAWTPKKSIVTLRNPSNKQAVIDLDAKKIFELPEGAPSVYVMKSPLVRDVKKSTVILTVGKNTSIQLKPFEVIILEEVKRNEQ